MTALTGRTNAKFITVKLGDSSNTLQDISAYVDSCGTIGLKSDASDVTAYSNGVKNFVLGRPDAPLQISGPWDSVLHAQMIALNGAQTPRTFNVLIGVRAAWESGAPSFGLAQSATSGYTVQDYMVDTKNMTWTATLAVFGPTAPAWGTSALA